MNVMFRYSEITYSLSVKREELQIFITKNIKEAVMVWRGINACLLKLGIMLKSKVQQLILRYARRNH